MKTAYFSSLVLALIVTATSRAESGSAPKETSVGNQPLGIAFSVKMTGPYAQDCDLQIICAFKHKASGDTYQGAMKDFDAKVGGLLSTRRDPQLAALYVLGVATLALWGGGSHSLDALLWSPAGGAGR